MLQYPAWSHCIRVLVAWARACVCGWGFNARGGVKQIQVHRRSPPKSTMLVRSAIPNGVRRTHLGASDLTVCRQLLVWVCAHVCVCVWVCARIISMCNCYPSQNHPGENRAHRNSSPSCRREVCIVILRLVVRRRHVHHADVRALVLAQTNLSSKPFPSTTVISWFENSGFVPPVQGASVFVSTCFL